MKQIICQNKECDVVINNPRINQHYCSIACLRQNKNTGDDLTKLKQKCDSPECKEKASGLFRKKFYCSEHYYKMRKEARLKK